MIGGAHRSAVFIRLGHERGSWLEDRGFLCSRLGCSPLSRIPKNPANDPHIEAPARGGLTRGACILREGSDEVPFEVANDEVADERLDPSLSRIAHEIRGHCAHA